MKEKVSYTIDEELIKAMNKLSKRFDRSASYLANVAISDYVAKYEIKPIGGNKQ